MTQAQLARLDAAALNRAFLGFDRIFNNFENRWANQINTNYPPFNIERNGDTYAITLAVAGFEKEEIAVSVDQDNLIISGEKKDTSDSEKEYVHRGLALRNFEKAFQMSEHMEVKSAEIKNGLLTVTIERVVPEALLPRKIQILESK